MRFSADMIAGSGLRSGDANITTVAPYAQVNVGVAREFLLPDDPKPMILRFDVVNLFDTIIRSGAEAASACSLRNSDRAAAISSEYRKSFEKPTHHSLETDGERNGSH